MLKPIKKRKCKNCKTYFKPDYRNVKKQKYCSKPECRKASKADSQKRWLEKTENQDYFRGSENVKRVQEWRENNPDYSKKNQRQKKNTLQEHLTENNIQNQPLTTNSMSDTLQDILTDQTIVLIGIIAQLSDSALQEDISVAAKSLVKLGHEILNQQKSFYGDNHDSKIPFMSGTYPQSSPPIQLAGSSSCS